MGAGGDLPDLAVGVIRPGDGGGLVHGGLWLTGGRCALAYLSYGCSGPRLFGTLCRDVSRWAHVPSEALLVDAPCGLSPLLEIRRVSEARVICLVNTAGYQWVEDRQCADPRPTQKGQTPQTDMTRSEHSTAQETRRVSEAPIDCLANTAGYQWAES